MGREEDPAAQPIRIAEGRLPANDGRLVRIRARFVDRTMLAYGATNILQLWLQADAEVFEARLENVAATNLNLAEGALVEATGVCLPVFGELRKPRGMRLLLRSTKDLQPAQDTVSWLSDRVLKILLVVAAIAAILAVVVPAQADDAQSQPAAPPAADAQTTPLAPTSDTIRPPSSMVAITVTA